MKRSVTSALILAVPAILVCGMFGYSWAQLSSQNAKISQEIERVVGKNRELEKRLHGLRSEEQTYIEPPDLVWSSDDTSNIELIFQTVVLELADRNKLLPRRFNAVQMEDGLAFRRVGFVIDGEGDLENLAQFLRDVETYQSRIAFENLRIRNGQRSRPVDGKTMVSFSMLFWIFYSSDVLD